MARENNGPMDKILIYVRQQYIGALISSALLRMSDILSRVFWVLTTLSLEEIRPFGGTYHLDLQRRRVRRARSHQKKATSSAGFLLHLFFNPEN
jgi:hypothetical protein